MLLLPRHGPFRCMWLHVACIENPLTTLAVHPARRSKGSMSTATPNTSLYIKNINTKVKKPGMYIMTHSSELRRQLYSLFGSYGKVLDVVATRADGMRGQAFIVFRDLQSANAALRALDGFEFYEKPLVCESRSHSRSWNMHEHDPRRLL